MSRQYDAGNGYPGYDNYGDEYGYSGSSGQSGSYGGYDGESMYDGYGRYESSDDGYGRQSGYGRGGYDYDDGYAYNDLYDDYDDYDHSYDRGRQSGSSRRQSSARSGRASSAGRRASSVNGSRAAGSRNSSGQRRGRASGQSSAGRNARGKRRQSAQGGTPIVAIVLMIILLFGVFAVKIFLDRYSYSHEEADLNAWFEMQGEGDVAVVWGNELSDIRAKKIDGAYYLQLSAVKEKLNDRFYYGRQNDEDTTGMIIYCLPTDKMITRIGSSEVSSSNETQTRDYIPARMFDNEIWLALDYVQEYTNFSWASYENPERIRIVSEWGTLTTAKVNRRTQIRTSGGIKSPVLEELDKGDTLTIIDQMETWSRVISENAIIGYVENKRMGSITEEESTPVTTYQEPEYTMHQLGTKVNMAFHNVYSTAAANDTLLNFMAPTKSVNVIAPTIFWVKSSAGDISSFASQYYVDTAHSLGLKVWAVVDNINSTELPDTSSFLGTLDSRDNLISQLLGECLNYGYDGINVDFELIASEYGQDYVEFIRELSIACRNNGLTMSVDDYPAYEYNSYYNLREQGVFADYVVIMGYDEHYGGSQQAGSVSSISYVTDAISMAVNLVDKSKVINAVPFYTRYWKTTGGVVTSEAYGMKDIPEIIANHNMMVSWNAAAGQNYAEATEGDTLLQIWVEDVQSLQLKLDVMSSAQIAGIAEWKLDFETPDVWDIIANYMNQ